jgi:UDP-glucose:(heptosyl)LPS alpha-1,3-glucosyltransferase
MKLGVLLDRCDGRAGGAEAHTAALMTRALEHGDGVVLATLSGAAPAGVETLTISAPRRRPARDRHFAREGAARLRSAGADVVFAIRHALSCDVYLPHGGLVGDARAAKDEAAGGVGSFAQLGRIWSGKHAFFEEAEAALLGPVEGPQVIAVSRMVAQRIRARYPNAARRTRVVLNGVDSEHFQRRPFQEAGQRLRAGSGAPDALVALLVAHHPRLKGAEAALRALAESGLRSGSRPLHLWIVGGALPRDLERLARRLGVHARVHCHPAVADMRPYYAAADLLLHPTFYDPCSLVCLEAMAMSLPVITTPRNGVAEVMGHRAGIVVEEPGNPAALAVALSVLADDGMRAGTGRDARELAVRNPWTARLDDVLEVCRQAAQAGTPSGTQAG